MSDASTAPEILVAADDVELAALAAELLARAIDDAVRERGAARIALSGGSTPAPAYRALSGYQLPWPKVEIYVVDERAVPPEHDRSNAKMLAAALDPAIRAGARFVRMNAEQADRRLAALEYDRALRKSFGPARAATFDAILLGVGDDGHTASIFPGRGSTAFDDRLVAAVEAADGLEPRLTMTVPVLVAARLVVVLAKGAAKKGPIARALEPGAVEEIPARVIRGCEGRVVWVLDRAAAP